MYHISTDSTSSTVPEGIILKTNYIEDTVTFSKSAGLLKWYGTNFAAFGFQQINSPVGVRNVFYINKISFE